MKPNRTFISIPSLPAALENLRQVAYNLRWAWDYDTIELFRRLDNDLWEKTGHNPVLMLGMIDQSQLESAAHDDGFLSHLDRVYRSLEVYLAAKSTWYSRLPDKPADTLIAYFSAEFGVTECLTIFAGGLGVLAGDHLKSASDLGVPLVGVSLLYQQGYFQQYLNEVGWQQEKYEDNDFHNLPITPVRNEDRSPLVVTIQFPGREVQVQVWMAQVGRIRLYLLDTNIPVNRPEDRDITDQLYGGNVEMRIKQEIILGIGGYRALEALGIKPTIYHMNEGHSAFLSLERIRRLMETESLSFQEASEAASAGMVFTTHTNVGAGHDYFSMELMDRYFTDFYHGLGLSRRDFLALGRQDPNNEGESFCQTILALKMAAYSNGVSQLHGRVARKMWQGLWKGVPEGEIPIGHVTNGVHLHTWISRDLNQIYERYMGYRWQTEPADQHAWQRVDQIPAAELWRTHERRRERLVAFTRNRLRQQLLRRGASQSELEIADEVLDPDALTIGFARRFATYKRASLILRDLERLARILNNPDRPVQIIFSGKAHPKDDPGKELIRQVVETARKPAFRRKIVFLEDYDMAVARYLVQGTDVWLNTPLRLQEASGTSGIKAAMNGVMNLSTLDGWWDEVYQPMIGWAIGRGEIYSDPEYQTQVEAEALYGLLEQDIVPQFYERGADGLPVGWINRMKSSIKSIGYFFNTHRMLDEYTHSFYLPGSVHYKALIEDGFARAKSLATWKSKIMSNWSNVGAEVVDCCVDEEIEVGEELRPQARIYLGSLTPEDVRVELYLGQIDASGEIVDADIIPMTLLEHEQNGAYLYVANHVTCKKSGIHGYTLRVLPCHPDLLTSFMPGTIRWA